MSWADFRQELSSQITPELCREVRRLRTEGDGETWRGVADEIFHHTSSSVIAEHAHMKGHQPLGMYLCELCAEMLNENPNAEPWN